MNDDDQAIIKNEFKVQNFGLKYKHTENFIQCQWQRDKSTISATYLIYRCVVSVYFLVTLFVCMCGVGRKYDYIHSLASWPIYLTSWGYVMYTLQACLGSAILLHRLIEEGNGGATLKKDTSMNWCFQLYWVLHTIAVVIGFAITGSFWVAVYDPAQHQVDTVSIVAHVLNSVVMGLDLLLVAHPIRLLHVHWPVGFLMSYFAFSLVYFWLDGTDIRGQLHIYSILDWQRPVRTIVICLMALTYTALTHVFTWALYMCRRWVGRWVMERQRPVPTETVIVNSYA